LKITIGSSLDFAIMALCSQGWTERGNEVSALFTAYPRKINELYSIVEEVKIYLKDSI
jgi:hypothetical protein